MIAADTVDASADCPKLMRFGPCGGVSSNGCCEVDGRHCPFLGVTLEWTGATHTPRPTPLGGGASRSSFLVDVRPSKDPGATRDVAAILGDRSTALLGEHLDDPTGTSVDDQVDELTAGGLRCLATVTGRGRRHELRIRRILGAGAIGILCVTGDHPDARAITARVEFRTEGTRLAGLARDAGAPLVAVAESPSSPPGHDRVTRLAIKERAGADTVVLNHAGSADRVTAFAQRAVDAGVDLSVVAAVPVITDPVSAEALAQFPGVELPPDYVDRVISTADARRAGIDAAARMAARLLAHPAISAVNLSGSATAGQAVERAEIMREVIDAVVAERTT